MLSNEGEKYISKGQDWSTGIDYVNKQLTPDRSSLAMGLTSESVLKRFDDLTHDTFEHCQRVGNYVRDFGEELGLSVDELFALTLGAQLHDLGKAAEVLSIVQPNILTSEEQKYIESVPHQDIGFTLLRNMRFPFEVINIVRDHHVLGFTEVDKLTNIVKIWDRFDAITAGRFGPPTLPVIAQQRIQVQFGTQLDPQFEDLFVSIVRRKNK